MKPGRCCTWKIWDCSRKKTGANISWHLTHCQLVKVIYCLHVQLHGLVKMQMLEMNFWRSMGTFTHIWKYKPWQQMQGLDFFCYFTCQYLAKELFSILWGEPDLNRLLETQCSKEPTYEHAGSILHTNTSHVSQIIPIGILNNCSLYLFYVQSTSYVHAVSFYIWTSNRQ